jgi:hypothetical protein
MARRKWTKKQREVQSQKLKLYHMEREQKLLDQKMEIMKGDFDGFKAKELAPKKVAKKKEALKYTSVTDDEGKPLVIFAKGKPVTHIYVTIDGVEKVFPIHPVTDMTTGNKINPEDMIAPTWGDVKDALEKAVADKKDYTANQMFVHGMVLFFIGIVVGISLCRAI